MKAGISIIVNFLVTVLAVFTATKLFIPSTPTIDSAKIPETLTTQIKDIQMRLGAIEDSLSNQKLDHKLDIIMEKLSILETRIDDIQPTHTSQPRPLSSLAPNNLQESFRTTGQNPIGWLQNLSEEKRREVDYIFEEHAKRLRERLPLESDGRLPDRESIKKIMDESDLELKEELKAVLTDEEYQSFLDSHPKAHSIKFPSLPFGESEISK
jgi:hypothetical protein